MTVAMKSNLYIDALTFRSGKAFGYNEYLSSLLDNFYDCRHSLRFSDIVIVCESSQAEYFEKYSDKFIVRSFSFPTFAHRALHQCFWNRELHVKRNDVVLCTANYAPFLKRGREVLVIHDLLFKHKKLSGRLPLVWRLQRHLFVPRSIFRADKIIAISNFTKAEIKKYYKKEEEVEVIYNSFKFEKFENSNEGRNAMRDYIIVVSSSAGHKRIEFILRAFARYCGMGGRLDLVIVGRIENNQEAMRAYCRLPEDIRSRITISHGLSELELSGMYSRARLYLSASLYEGLGMPVVEAMCCSLPLVLPDSPLIFKEVTDGNGIFFDSSSEESLAETLLASEDMGKVHYDMERFSKENTSRKYIDLLNGFCE